MSTMVLVYLRSSKDRTMKTIERKKTEDDIIDLIHTLVSEGEVQRAIELYNNFKGRIEHGSVFIEY